MNKTMTAVLAIAFGMTTISANAMENDQQKAAPAAKSAKLDSIGGNGKACKDGKCGNQGESKAGMGGCCCASMMSKNMGMMGNHGDMSMNQESAGVMDPATMTVRMRMMEERMEMMQKMMMEQKSRS